MPFTRAGQKMIRVHPLMLQATNNMQVDENITNWRKYYKLMKAMWGEERLENVSFMFIFMQVVYYSENGTIFSNQRNEIFEKATHVCWFLHTFFNHV